VNQDRRESTQKPKQPTRRDEMKDVKSIEEMNTEDELRVEQFRESIRGQRASTRLVEANIRMRLAEAIVIERRTQ